MDKTNKTPYQVSKDTGISTATDQKIQLLAQGNVELTEKIDKVDKDLQEFKADMPLLALECQRITRAKNQKVVPLMGGKSAPAYKNKSLMQGQNNRVWR